MSSETRIIRSSSKISHRRTSYDGLFEEHEEFLDSLEEYTCKRETASSAPLPNFSGKFLEWLFILFIAVILVATGNAEIFEALLAASEILKLLR